MTFLNASGDTAISAASVTAAVNGPAMFLPGASGGSNVLVALHATAATGTSPTLDVKLQDSADGVTFADVTGATTSASTHLTGAGNAVVFGRTNKQFVRAVLTTGGTTPNFSNVTVSVLGASAAV